MSGMHHHPTQLSERQRNEAAVYDARVAASALSEGDLRTDGSIPPYPNREHVDFLDFAFEQMGSLSGRRILEVGCGTGSLAVYLALRGADVVGLDVSEGALSVSRSRALANGVESRVDFLLHPVETLDHPDAHYDIVIGNQVLHHLVLDEAMRNVRRMLSPGGIAVFCEPVLFLPEWARRLRNSQIVTKLFPSRADTPDERSLGRRELAAMLAEFPFGDWKPFQLLCRLQNFFELSDRQFARLERIDRFLLSRVPITRTLCRYVVVILRNEMDQRAKGATR